LVDRLTSRLRRQGRRVAIVAVDPTSPFSGGSLLGDRIRLQARQDDPGVFFRSMASRGHLGGLAATTVDIVTVLAASGADVVLVETVGVGQGEVDVMRVVGVVALLVPPSAGDDIQTIKAGILEIADVFVISKADLPGADDVHRQLEAMLSLSESRDRPRPPIVRTIADRDEGVESLLEALRGVSPRHEDSQEYWRQRLVEALRSSLLDTLQGDLLDPGEIEKTAQEIAAGQSNPYDFVDTVLQRIKRRMK
jgi:LAO/AO transport system kinase